VPTTRLVTSADLPTWLVGVACALALGSLALLVLEMRRRERGGAAIALSGALAALALLAAVLRPVRVAARESRVGAKIVVLADTSRSMALTDGAAPRSAARDRAIAWLAASAPEARFVPMGFGVGPPHALGAGPASTEAPRSDLAAAIRALASSPEEPPRAVVVVSDGRLDDPREGSSPDALRELAAGLKVPIHAIATTRRAPADASVRAVAAAGAAVAHVPLPLRVEVGCAGGLACDELTVTARELREDGPPALLASGLAHVKDGLASLDLTITLDRAGPRIVEVAISAPSGDTIPENDRRLITFHVARERIRVLHVAGRPTDDVRELRHWLKSDASVDLVAFFILRTPSDVTNTTSQDELALIPFPVDELFSEHLPSFDAVILQDFDAQPYGLERHLPALARYVRAGGGLVMVGGPNSFVAGGYAGTPLGAVLPVRLDGSPGATAADPATFTPSWTEAGREAPMLAPLRDLLGDELPPMPGANVLGDARDSGIVLWTHPSRTTPSGNPMPILAVGDEGNGRTLALAVDGTWMLKFSELGARTAGRAHGALWDGLLGWLMRDPRFEPAQIAAPEGCAASAKTVLRLRAAGPRSRRAKVVLDVIRIDAERPPIHVEREGVPLGEPLDVELPPLSPGAYSARIRVGDGPTTRRDFACEAGGDEWADSRPDGERLAALAAATGGAFLWEGDRGALPLPEPTVVSAERHVVPIAPAWVWSLAAAALLGLHWYVRRRSGLV
jgi:uncharacterized membrane protein